MKLILRLISYAGLLITLMSAVLTARGNLELETHYAWLLAGMILWFATAPFWMKGQTD